MYYCCTQQALWRGTAVVKFYDGIISGSIICVKAIFQMFPNCPGKISFFSLFFPGSRNFSNIASLFRAHALTGTRDRHAWKTRVTVMGPRGILDMRDIIWEQFLNVPPAVDSSTWQRHAGTRKKNERRNAKTTHSCQIVLPATHSIISALRMFVWGERGWKILSPEVCQQKLR